MPTTCCCYTQFPLVDSPEGEWLPMGLRETVCLLRRSDPQKYRAVLRERGVELEPDDLHCLHNADATWVECPLYRARK